MATAYRIEQRQGITQVQFLVAPSIALFEQAIQEIAPLRPQLRLWDLSGPGWHLSSAELARLADFARERFPLPARVAFVVGSDLAYGLTRIHEAFREQPQLAFGVFRDREEALAWLLAAPLG